MRSLGGLVLLGVLLWAAPALAAAGNLLRNGDLEEASDARPPPGWAMWGDQQFKDPTNFTRDTQDPHGGRACLRIRHPAKTAGYLVTSPEQPIRTRRGMRYTVTFWARAAKPGHAVFGFDAYETIRPYVGAPSPGFFPVDVGREWRRFAFEVHEGWDFFAERTRLVLLVFKATADADEEQTLWVDDVAVAEAPSPREGRLLDEAALAVAPLAHGVRPGAALAFTVDAAKLLRRATRAAGGISFHRVAGWTGVPYDKQGAYVLAPELEAAVRDLRLPMTRFYAVGDEPFGLEAAIDKAAEMVRRVGIAEEAVPLEFEVQAATSLLPPETWARGVRHSLARGYKFFRWEVTNEPCVQSARATFPTPDAYVDHFLAVSRAIREAHPAGHVGIAVAGRDTAWGNYVLKRAAGHYDFVVGHFYTFANLYQEPFEAVVLGANYATLDDVARTGALMRAYNPGRDVYQYDTEWGLHGRGPRGERADDADRNANIVGTMHRAVRLIHYAREDLVRGASSWEMFTRVGGQGFAVLSPEAPAKRGLIYWLYHAFNRHVGDWVVETDGTAPFGEWTVEGRTVRGPETPLLATVSDDGRTMYLVIANGSWTKAAPCDVSLRNFRAAEASALALSSDDLDGKPLVDRREDVLSACPVTLGEAHLGLTVPPHAVVFVTVTAR